jgi:hypothetical protein
MNEQSEQLTRVNSAIAIFVEAFVSSHTTWHVSDLQRYVFDRVDGYVAPASPDRILRDLRQKKVIDYEVVNRRKSLYRTIAMKGQGELFR